MSTLPQKRYSSECGNGHDRSSPIFCNLSLEVLKDYDAIGMHIYLPKGALLFQQDDPGYFVDVICTGQVKVSCASREGKTLILKIAMPGEVLGLGAVISGTTYETSAETLTPTHVKTIRSDEFLAFLRKYPEASMQVAQALSEEYKSAFFSVRLLGLSPSAAGRLAAVLLDWGRVASAGKLEMRFTMALTHEELGHLAGVTRETVTRVLGLFQKQKLIQVQGSSILIKAPDRLKRLAA